MKFNGKTIYRTAYYVMLAVIAGLLSIPLPFTPLRFSLLTLFAIVSGITLGRYAGAAAQALYILLGLAGVPIFGGGAGGISSVRELWFGYTLMLVPAAYISGFAFSRLKQTRLFFNLVPALVFLYAVGLVYQTIVISSQGGEQRPALIGAALFFIIDIILLYVFCLIYPRLTDTQKIEEPQHQAKATSS